MIFNATRAAGAAAYAAEVRAFALECQGKTKIGAVTISEADAAIILTFSPHYRAIEHEHEDPANCGWKSWDEASKEQRAYWALNYDAALALRDLRAAGRA